MPDILLHYERVNPTSWAYLSSLLMLALYFKFNRIWSVRNFDLFLLIALSPGLLLVQWAAENAATNSNANSIEYLGFVWLFATGAALLLRLLLDPMMVRRPLLEANLNASGLMFLGGSLLFFLMANVVTGSPSAADLAPARDAEELRAEGTEVVPLDQSTFATRGPGYWLIFSQPRILTQQLIGAGDRSIQETPAERRLRVQEATVRIVVILAHVMIVLGVISIGHGHFGNINAGIAVATLYLMLPYTALWTGSVDHALPASLLVWAVVLYRRPLLAGMMVGLASGTMYYPAFLLPLWCSFYWHRGVKRFTAGVLLMIVVLVATMAITATSMDQFLANLLQMFGIRLPATTNLGGIWGTWPTGYRLPVIAAFVILSVSFAIWPVQKNLATLISGSASLLLAVQFWHAYDGGIYIAWYLPLLLLTIFRPNLEDCVALAKLSEGWRRASKQQAIDAQSNLR